MRTAPPIERQVRGARRRRAWKAKLLGLVFMVATMVPARAFLEESLGWPARRTAVLTIAIGLILWFASESYLVRWIARRELDRGSRPAA